jgi:hypothetical protein
VAPNSGREIPPVVATAAPLLARGMLRLRTDVLLGVAMTESAWPPAAVEACCGKDSWTKAGQPFAVSCSLCPSSPGYWQKGAVLHRMQHSASLNRASNVAG